MTMPRIIFALTLAAVLGSLQQDFGLSSTEGIG